MISSSFGGRSGFRRCGTTGIRFRMESKTTPELSKCSSESMVACDMPPAAIMPLPLGITFREPEIEHFRVSTLSDENIRRFDVAVDNAGAVSSVQRIGNLNSE